MSKYRIGILGIGAVGGFFGVKLFNTYKDTSEVELIFIARGKTRDIIGKDGLKVITGELVETAYPKLVTNDPQEIGQLDLLIIATKSYDLAEAVKQVLPSVNEQTLILPLVNGVGAEEMIRSVLKTGKILTGFVYLIAGLASPGVINYAGKGHSLVFGSKEDVIKELEFLKNIFQRAGINAIVPPDILLAAWEKFFFISPMATITCYLNKTIHQIADDEENRNLWLELLRELHVLAVAKHIPLPDNIIESTLAKGDTLPTEATTSMYRDHKCGNKIELESLTGYVINEAERLNVDVPLFKMMYVALERKA